MRLGISTLRYWRRKRLVVLTFLLCSAALGTLLFHSLRATASKPVEQAEQSKEQEKLIWPQELYQKSAGGAVQQKSFGRAVQQKSVGRSVQQKSIGRAVQQKQEEDRNYDEEADRNSDRDTDQGDEIKEPRKYKKVHGGWELHHEPVTKDWRRWGQMKLDGDNVDKDSREKDEMDAPDKLLQKALAHRHIPSVKNSRNMAVNEMQNSLGKPRNKGWNNMNDPLNQLMGARDKARQKLNQRARNEKEKSVKARYSDDLSSHRSPKPIGLGRSQDLKFQIDNNLHGRFQESMGASMDTHQSSEMKQVLGDFDVEGYLRPQRMFKGQGDPMKAFQFNQVASDATPPDRPLRDYRDPRCHNSREQYMDDLASTSIIICFTNEARSALLRTIISVLIRSPPSLIEEILLVDDFSDNPMDGKMLTVIPKVRLLRMDSRQGLIRSRIRGADSARGSVLLFLDSHCEVITGWLQPLLSRIKTNRTVIASPVIDIIDKNNMAYTPASSTVKGGFDSSLHFKWDSMTPSEKHSRVNPISPIRTPAIAGGLFAVDKDWFEHIGKYDDQMEIWGAENVGM